MSPSHQHESISFAFSIRCRRDQDNIERSLFYSTASILNLDQVVLRPWRPVACQLQHDRATVDGGVEVVDMAGVMVKLVRIVIFAVDLNRQRLFLQ